MERIRPQSLRESLKGILTEEEMKVANRSFELVGDIAILEIPEGLKKKEKQMAKALLETHKNIKVVVKKKGGHEGTFRIQKYSVLAGQRRKETEYKEHNCRFKLNIEKTYFSSRLSNERKRIFQKVQPGEDILVMFSGVSPYPITLARNSKPKEIYAIEINPDAHKYAQENINLNKVKNVVLFCGDVNEVVPKLKKKFDRILMPLPRSAEDFLETALSAIKSNGIIHFYDFEFESEFKKGEDKVMHACKAAGKRCKILETVKCGQNGPRYFRICVDFQVLD